MANTDQPQTFSDLYTLLINSVQQNASQSVTVALAKGAINRALHDMHIGYDYRYPWAERSAYLVTQPSYTTGTIDITQGDATISGSTTAWTDTNAFGVANVRAGGKLKVAGHREVYEVASVTSGTELELSSGVTASTETGLSYTYYEDEYDLASDFFKTVDAQKFSEDYPIPLIGRTEFRQKYGSNSVPSRIRVATLRDAEFSSSTTRVRRVVFAPPPSEFRQIKYHYITTQLATNSSGTRQVQLSGDTDEPIVPLRYRHAIVYYALYQWYRDRKDDQQRARDAKADYTDLMMRIANDNEIGGTTPRIRPAMRGYRRRARRPYSGAGSRRYDVNGGFDRLE